MADIFLSYARDDGAIAAAVRERLLEKGWSVFFDVASIRAGADFAREIDTQIRSANAVVACWSLNAFRSDWCLKEARVGSLRNTLVPVAISPFTDIDMPIEFLGTNYFRAFENGSIDERGIDRVVAELQLLCGPPLKAAELPVAIVAPRVDDDEWLLVPVSRDGSKFTPDIRGSRGYTVGEKGAEIIVEDYFDALKQLSAMTSPRWRRPNTNGIPGIVTGVRWERFPLKTAKFISNLF